MEPQSEYFFYVLLPPQTEKPMTELELGKQFCILSHDWSVRHLHGILPHSLTVVSLS